MATPLTTTVPQGLTGDPVVDVMTTGYRWILGADRTIDWSVSNGLTGDFWNAPATVAQYAGAALDVFSYYANVKFNYVGTYSSPFAANLAGSEIDLTVDHTGSVFSSSNVWAMGLFPNTAYNSLYYQGAPGDLFLNVSSAANTLASYEPGSIGWAVLLHELGHTLGLKHPHDDGGTGHPTFAQLGLSQFDQNWFTVMSYSDDYQWNQLNWHPATPMLLDVLALQYLYGPNTSTNAGDSLYNLSADNLFLTIWDASGNDTVSLANVGSGWTVQLPNFQASALVSTLAGYAIPNSDLHLATPHSFYWLTGNLENLVGSAYADNLSGNNLGNQIMAGAGDDTVTAGGGGGYIRGEDGNDSIVGGAGFDDINGNKGDDTITGGAGGDWLVGGQGNDLITSQGGNDILYGNIGNDTLLGSSGSEILRGGQDNDSILGGAGNDWLSGDKGSDTIAGGAGADTFHISVGAGIDRVIDFNAAEGDRVQLDAGTSYHVGQVGADVVIDLGSGDEMILTGVQMTPAAANWIFLL